MANATMSSEPLRLAVLLSGSGRTLQNLLERIAQGRLHARIALVIANRAEAYGLRRAQAAALPTRVVPRREFPDAVAQSQAIFAACRDASAELVVLAGFLQLLAIPDDFANRVINIHPALLPAFGGPGMYGHFVHEAVLAYGARVSGCTVHFADHQYDHGPVIHQAVVPVLDDDTPETLAERVFAAECECYPEAIQWIAERRVRLEGRRVRVETRQPG